MNKAVQIIELTDDALQCIIETPGCTYRKLGSCFMCNYGCGRELSVNELLAELDKKLTPLIPHYNYVLFSTYGSIFDTDEFRHSSLEALLDYIRGLKINTVAFETHCKTINDNTLRFIRSKLPNQHIIVELGLESSDDYVLSNCINKYQSVIDVELAIKLLKQYNIEVDLNVMFGLPFMNTSKQIESTLDSINWAYNHGVNDIVLFPCNIKPETVLYKLYRHGDYTPISHWDFIELLTRIPDEILPKIQLSWYGNRISKDPESGLRSMPPTSCSKCKETLQEFYDKFVSTRDLVTRKKLLEEISTVDTNCSCRDESKQRVSEEPFIMDMESAWCKIRICTPII